MKRFMACLTICAVCMTSPCVRAQDDVADVPSVELHAGDDEQKTYFLIGAPADEPPLDAKFGLVIVMPGGDGSAEFNPFVKRIYQYALPEGHLVAQPVAVQWTPNQEIVWPTKKSKAAKMKFTTEEFVSAVIDDVEAKYALDPATIFTLSWSSSGPAAYAIALSEKRVTGSMIAMSIFRPKQLPALTAAKDRAFCVYHSPDDQVCPFRMAERAKKQLSANGATVKLKTYEGGHGWQGDVFGDIREGIDWLAEQNADPATE